MLVLKFSKMSLKFRCVRALAHLRTLMTHKNVHSRDAQCNTEESP